MLRYFSLDVISSSKPTAFSAEALFSENCSFLGTDNVLKKISGYILAPKGGCCFFQMVRKCKINGETLTLSFVCTGQIFKPYHFKMVSAVPVDCSLVIFSRYCFQKNINVF